MANGRETTVTLQCVGGKEVYVKSEDVGRGAGVEKVLISSVTKIDPPPTGSRGSPHEY